MVLSPLLSMKGITYRFILRSKQDRNLCRDLTIFMNLLFIVPVLIFVLYMFNYTDERPEWAKQFNTVRYGLNHDEYP